MDRNLNKDLHEGVNWLCCITNCLDDTFDRVVDEAYLRIFEAQGIVVPHLGTRHGRRNDRSIGQLPRGGKMIKTEEFQRKWIQLQKVSSLRTVEL